MLLRSVLCCLAVLASAGASRAANTVGNHGMTLVRLPFAGQAKPPAPRDKGLKTIFSNLGTLYPLAVYYPMEGYSVAGDSAGDGSVLWHAAPFTPSANATLSEIDVGVGNVGGSMGLTIGLYADAAGVPGALIKSWNVKNVPAAGCCMLVSVKERSGIPVAAGMQYWVALTTSSKQMTAADVWYFNTTDEVDAIAFATNTGSGWSATTGPFTPAYGVYGR